LPEPDWKMVTPAKPKYLSGSNFHRGNSIRERSNSPAFPNRVGFDTGSFHTLFSYGPQVSILFANIVVLLLDRHAVLCGGHHLLGLLRFRPFRNKDLVPRARMGAF
jgi:hypothetical protein